MASFIWTDLSSFLLLSQWKIQIQHLWWFTQKCVFVQKNPQNKTMDPIKGKVWTCNLSSPLSQLSSVASTAFFMTGRNSEVSRVSRRFAGPRCILLSHNSTTRRNCHKGKVCSKSPRRRADTAWETPAKAMCSCVSTDVEHLLKDCQAYLEVDI